MRTNLRTVAILFVVGGALQTIALLVSLFAKTVSPLPLFALSNLALAIAFLLLALGTLGGTLGRVAFWVATAGWLILTLLSLTNIGVFGLIGLAAGIIGSFGAGIVVYMGKLFTRQANIWFLIAMILATIYLLNLIGAIVGLAFGIVTVVAAIFIAQRK